MPGAFLADDLATMFAVDEFGTSASWTPEAGGTPTVATVIFDAPGSLILDDVMSAEPSVLYRVADWPTVRERDTVVLGATTYKVRQVMPLSDGAIARALLRRP